MLFIYTACLYVCQCDTPPSAYLSHAMCGYTFTIKSSNTQCRNKPIDCLVFQPIIRTAVDHGCRYILISKEIADINDVDTDSQHMHGFAMAESMRLYFFWERRVRPADLIHLFADDVVHSVTVHFPVPTVYYQRLVYKKNVSLPVHVL